MVEPEQSVQALFDAYPRVTRLYTLLSPAEMTVDPELFRVPTSYDQLKSP